MNNKTAFWIIFSLITFGGFYISYSKDKFLVGSLITLSIALLFAFLFSSIITNEEKK